MSVEAVADIHVEDVEYLRHPSGPLLARIYRPKEGRPRAALVSMHGGRWTRETRLTNTVIDEALARDGALVMALDIRMPPVAGYPDCLADINYAIRWLKVYARMLGVPDGRLGGIGTSSGGHQMTLSALRPRDPRYASIPRSRRRRRLAGVPHRRLAGARSARPLPDGEGARQRGDAVARTMPTGRTRRRRPKATRR